MQSGDKVVIQGPISIGRTLVYTFLLSPVIVVFSFLVMSAILQVFPGLQGRKSDVLATIPVLGIWSLLFIVAQYSPGTENITIHRSRNTFQITRGKTSSEEYDLDSVTRFIVKKFICPSPGSKQYKLLIERTDGNVLELLSDDFANYYRRRWKALVSKLAEISLKPIDEEAYLEKYDGTVAPYTEKDSSTGYLYLLIPFLISAFCAFLLGFYPTLRTFLIMGAFAVLTNLFFLVMYQRKLGEKMLCSLETKLTRTGMLFSLVISLAVSYTLFAVIINGLGFLSTW